jgi:hypothetical protein
VVAERKPLLPQHLGRWLFGLVSLVLLALTFRPVVEGDGVGYYAYLHAAFVSHSLDFASEFSAAIASNVPLFVPLVTTRTATGQLGDFFPVGAAVLSSPAYLIALALRPSGDPQYGSPFIEAFTLASLLYGLLGLAICYRLATAIGLSTRGALIGVVGAIFATPLAYYMLTDPSYSHTFSVFCVSAFLYMWWSGPPRTCWRWFGLGLLGGLMAMTRFQDGLLVAIVLIDFRRLRWPALAFLPGMLVGFAPQLAVDQMQFGNWLPQRFPGQALDPSNGHYFDVLFSSQEGLFVWTPLALLAVAGFVFIKDRRITIACVTAFLIEVVVTGSAPDSGGAAFGPRRFLDLIPFVVLGIGSLAARIGPRLDWPVVGALCAWNLALVANFEYVMPPATRPSYAALLQGQLAAVPHVPKLFAKGAVVRDLLLWRQAHTRFDPVGGLSLLVLEAGCTAVAVLAATWSRRRGPRVADASGAAG